MTSADPCPQCGTSPAEHDVYGNCPSDQPGPVIVAVGVVIRRWRVHTAALMLAALAGLLTGYHG
jgi:hypothetical protein